MRPTCVFTVASESTSRAAISPFDRPWATSSMTSRSRPVSRSRAPLAALSCRALGSMAEKRSSSRRVVDGATTASPLCTARIAVSSSDGGTSLSMKPLAPALSPEKAYSSRSNVVRMSTLGGSGSAQMRRVASTPSSRGMRTSIRTTSTAVPRRFSIASAPSPASATTSMSGWAASTMRKPVRNSIWSSTSITRIDIGGFHLLRRGGRSVGRTVQGGRSVGRAV